MRLQEAWAPHGRFRAASQRLSPEIELPPGGSMVVELPTAFSELPGTVVENAFLILRLLWQEQPWRVFTRMRVLVDESGAPRPVCELTTAQTVGFSANMSGA